MKNLKTNIKGRRRRRRKKDDMLTGKYIKYMISILPAIKETFFRQSYNKILFFFLEKLGHKIIYMS